VPTDATIKARLLALGFTLTDSPIGQYCKYVVGPNGETYGPLTANECAEKFLGQSCPAIAHSIQLTDDDSTSEAAKVREAGARTRGARAGLPFEERR